MAIGGHRRASWQIIKVCLAVVGVSALCLISGVIGGAVTRNFGTSSYTVSYADFISILLSAISVLMTLLAMFFAVFGLIGWSAITNRVKSRTEDFLEDGFKEGNTLYVMLRARATEIMYEGIDPVDGGPESNPTSEEG